MTNSANNIVSEISETMPMKTKKERKTTIKPKIEEQNTKSSPEPKPRGRKPVAKNIVYSVKCIDQNIDPKIYVGSTCNSLAVRKLIHLNCVKNGYESNDLYINMRKNGIDKYEFNIECVVKPNEEGKIMKEDLKREEDRISNEYKAKGISLYNIRRAHADNKPETASSKWRKANSNRYTCQHCGICTSDRIQMINHFQSRKHFKFTLESCQNDKKTALKDIENSIYSLSNNDPKDLNELFRSIVDQLYKTNNVTYNPTKSISESISNTTSQNPKHKETKIRKLNISFQLKALLVDMLKRKRVVISVMKQQQSLRYP